MRHHGPGLCPGGGQGGRPGLERRSGEEAGRRVQGRGLCLRGIQSQRAGAGGSGGRPPAGAEGSGPLRYPGERRGRQQRPSHHRQRIPARSPGRAKDLLRSGRGGRGLCL